jgi:cytochrome P450
VALGTQDAGQLAAHSRSCAERLAAKHLERRSPAGVQAFAFELSVHVTASLLGLPPEAFEAATAAVDGYVAALGPGGASLARAGKGARELLTLMDEQLVSPHPEGLLARFSEAATREGCAARDVLAANAAGFLTQAYEATAGLIGNTVLALGARPELAHALRQDPGLLGEVLAEVLRHDAPVQNTRRFVSEDTVVDGEALAGGDQILLVLAAASRDPEANPEPERFELFRKGRLSFTFGSGAHLCPGQALSVAIARAGIERLLATTRDAGELPKAVSYRPSLNVRVPHFVPAEG